ncbi:efflux RND transporter periplasmic adaptor subunit [Paucibacter sp. Y2R2-4]|uniref:efflux RND transporter periplasmic adaptor subunit n=1 Tax=Paucibacter sp. Y2R2-4 TaxID=2893553 RepID=UPI0021E4B3C3|nr:efflux RND transporter periplasmic adaptor subunit [Paucibacter sp. Y2R2-4]MCV2350992.1 efflux RND transporter periplasmic adaptor subunit [Paucibacter sp. Y2R2-4]
MSRKPALALIAVLVIGAAGAWVWNKKQAQPSEPGGSASAGATAASGPASGAASSKGGPQTVAVLAALKQDVPVMLEATGTVAALKQVDLRAQTTNTVKDVLVKDGQSVRKGDLLFRFDDRADRANVDKARAQLARDRATLADLQRQHQRAVDLKAQNFVAQSAVDSALSNLEAQRALIQSDEAALQSAQVALSYNEIRAPLSGRAGMVNVVAGSLVQANATALPLLSIAQLDPIAVGFSLPETQLAALLQATRQDKKAGTATAAAADKAEGLSAQVLMPGERSAKGAPSGEKPPTGRVSFVDNLVDSSTGTIKVRAEFDNAQQKLWPGQYVRVRLQLRTLKDATVIPQAAIIQRGSERSVYIVDANKTAQQKPVQIRYAFGDMAVVDGIAPGDKVVLDGKQNLRPGTPVKEQAAALNPAAKKPEAAASAAAASSAASGV